MPISSRQKSFFDQNHGGSVNCNHQITMPANANLHQTNRSHYPHNRNRNDARPEAPPHNPAMNSAPIAPGSQTKTKLKAFQFIEGKPASAVESADKENEVEEERPQSLQETPVKTTPLAASKGPPPSTPATRLPLADLIGNPDSNRVTAEHVSPEESILWLHAQTPSSSHPAITPARKRKRGRSSSPVSSSQNEQSNFFSGEKEPFNVHGLQQSLKTPQADPAADLWNRYHASANDGSAATKSVSFAHLIKDSSPRSSETAGSVNGLRRWASCGVEWPTSTTKRRRVSASRHDEQLRAEAGEEQGDGDMPRISTVGLLLERMKETLQKSQERPPEAPSSSSPLPERGYVDRGDELESPLNRLAPVIEEAQEDVRAEHAVDTTVPPPGSVRRSQRSSSEYGDDDIDVDMFEAAIECSAVPKQSQAPRPNFKAPQVDIIPAPSIVTDHPKLPDSNVVLPQSAVDEFDDAEDDLFAADLEQVAAKYDSRAAQVPPNAAVSQAPSFVPEESIDRTVTNKATPRQEVVVIEDDEFGDDDFDGDELIAAEAAATQAFQGSCADLASVCSGLNHSCR
jgi:DNA replication ATP-dependent helicase Dna2